MFKFKFRFKLTLAGWLAAGLTSASFLPARCEGLPSTPGPSPTITRIDPPEQGFYAKRLDYEGIAIKTSTNVVDEALFAARDRLSMMLTNLPGVRVRLRE
ncbi:MAG: hypothetical protein KDM81_04700, partial [Verrucomicrobiae bacterium]|nr:hypothetical protein [Verrucomicrobiae bacterium]